MNLRRRKIERGNERKKKKNYLNDSKHMLYAEAKWPKIVLNEKQEETFDMARRLDNNYMLYGSSLSSEVMQYIYRFILSVPSLPTNLDCSNCYISIGVLLKWVLVLKLVYSLADRIQNKTITNKNIDKQIDR